MSRVCQKAVQGHGGACVCAPPSDKVNVRPNIPTTRCDRHPPSSTARTRRKYLRFRPWNVAVVLALLGATISVRTENKPCAIGGWCTNQPAPQPHPRPALLTPQSLARLRSDPARGVRLSVLQAQRSLPRLASRNRSLAPALHRAQRATLAPRRVCHASRHDPGTGRRPSGAAMQRIAYAARVGAELRSVAHRHGNQSPHRRGPLRRGAAARDSAHDE